MFGVLLLLFLVVPILELYVFLQVAGSLGFLNTVGWVLAISATGAWLVKHEGMSVLRRANAQVRNGQLPADELVNGILLLFAGALLLTPGFLTDVLGLTLLFPPSRAMYRAVIRHRFQAGPIRIGRGVQFGAAAWPGRVAIFDAEAWEEPGDGPDRPMLG